MDTELSCYFGNGFRNTVLALGPTPPLDAPLLKYRLELLGPGHRIEVPTEQIDLADVLAFVTF
jgi:hypothetical protein